jgi:large subunit ribosomal protein L24
VFVEGLNIVKRHQRPSPQNPNAEAGVVEKEGPIHISNVMLLDPKDKKPTRVGISREGGSRNRVARRSGTKLD